MKERGGGKGSGATPKLFAPSLTSPLNQSLCISSCCVPAFRPCNANAWACFAAGHTQGTANRNPSISTAPQLSGSINTAGREWHKRDRLVAAHMTSTLQPPRTGEGTTPSQTPPHCLPILTMLKHHFYLLRSEVSSIVPCTSRNLPTLHTRSGGNRLSSHGLISLHMQRAMGFPHRGPHCPLP